MVSPQGPGWQQPGAVPQYYAGPAPTGEKGFFGALFDFGFNAFVAPKLMKFLYVLLLILLTIGAMFNVVIAFGMMASANQSGSGVPVVLGLMLLILTPVLWFLGLIIYRVAIELVMVVFKIHEDLKAIRQNRAMG